MKLSKNIIFISSIVWFLCLSTKANIYINHNTYFEESDLESLVELEEEFSNIDECAIYLKNKSGGLASTLSSLKIKSLKNSPLIPTNKVVEKNGKSGIRLYIKHCSLKIDY